MNFKALVKAGGTFTANGATFDAYLSWLETCQCKGCGKKRSDIPRDENGVALETWVTEIECMQCFEKRCANRDPDEVSDAHRN